MQAVPEAASRTSLALSTRSVPERKEAAPSSNLPLASLYCVSGLPKSPNTWTLSDPDSVAGLHHSESAVNRWWRPEILGSTVSPGPGVKRRKHQKPAGILSKQDVAKVLSKTLKVRSNSLIPSAKILIYFEKLSFTRDVEIIASTYVISASVMRLLIFLVLL
jgi:hypothetical protein